MSLKRNSETEVLMATINWLSQNNWKIETVSIPHNQNSMSILEQKQIIIEFLNNMRIDFKENQFKPNGPDIVASKGNENWNIECKGHSESKPQTQRNNFDRAIASAVSYYKNDNALIGLALPREYKKLASKRIPNALRNKINLSLFFFNSDKKNIEHILPTDNFDQVSLMFDGLEW